MTCPSGIAFEIGTLIVPLIAAQMPDAHWDEITEKAHELAAEFVDGLVY